MDRVEVAKTLARAKGLIWDDLDATARNRLLSFIDSRGIIAVYQTSTRQPYPAPSPA